jgi:bifunctional non-homologous end joining protein LigD
MSDRLKEYRRKRDPKQTSEPFRSGDGGTDGSPIFVVQRHDARRLHYDFRLERDGALASWAVPKGVPLEPGEQHLAVHVEDHPLEYAKFEGEIPAGNYGAGTVEIWDDGTYELLEEKRNGGLTVRLNGEKLNGVWALIPAHLDGKEQNWLIVRKREDTVAAAPQALEASAAKPPTPGRKSEAPSASQGKYWPMMATLEREVPRGDGWAFEVKWDGYRALAYVRDGECTLVSRNDKPLTQRFPQIAKEIVKAVRTPNAVLDGEVCALDEQGRASFSEMQKGSNMLVYYAFDVLEVDGVPLVDLAFTERHERLERLLDKRNRIVRVSETFDDGEALLDAARQQHLEGIMAKRVDSRYFPGKRTRDWLKIKTHGREEFIIAGYTHGGGRRAGTLGSLILATREGGELRYVGNVGTGFTDKEIRSLMAKLKPLRRDTSPFAVVPKMPRVRKDEIVWTEPKLVAEVEYVEYTHDGRLRAPSYQGLREDKPAEEVHREEPLHDVIKSRGRTLKLSNLDKVFWPGEGITKGDLLRYYQRIAPVVVPHLADRPFTMKRYPNGIDEKFFFQKDAPSHMPDWIPTYRALVSTREKPRQRKWVNFPLVNDELALLWMINMGCIDLNTWYSRIDKPDRPDFVLFDLDPAQGAGFPESVEVALLVKEALDALGLESFPKTSGSDGMHVLVPVERRHTYDDTREFAEIVAGALARTHRGLVTTEWTKAKRRGVLIDSNQNGEGKTIASVYSVRPHPGAPVSTPLRWDEVNEKLNPSIYSMEVVLDRVERFGDLYEGVLKTRQRLDRALAALR